MPHKIRKLALIVDDAGLRRDLQRLFARVERLDVVETVTAGAEWLDRRASLPELFVLDRSTLAALRERAGRDRMPGSPLTLQEQEVLRRLVLGLRTIDIALALGRSPKTVEKHRSSIHRKLGLRSVAQLTAYAIHVGLVSVEQVLRGG